MGTVRKFFGFSWIFYACAVFFMVACGSDSESSSGPENDSEIESDSGDESKSGSEDESKSGSEDKKKKEIQVDKKMSSSPVIIETKYDSRIREEFTSVQFGRYIWTAKNSSSERNVSGYTVCYANNGDNCDTYGRLYHNNAYNACPHDFYIPSEDDWKTIMSLRKQHPELAEALTFPLGGYCDYKSFSLKDEEGYYLTSNDRAAVVDSKGSVSFRDIKSDDYVSVRCIRRINCYATLDDLPDCEEDNSTLYYVMEKKSNYRCLGNRWVDDFSNTCRSQDEGTYSIYNDSMYICKNEQWQLASIEDSKELCTKEMEGTTYLFNGLQYACENERWRSFDAIERELGYCKESMDGKIDTVHYNYVVTGLYGWKGKYKLYVCDSRKWRDLEPSDLFGECDSTNLYKEAVYASTRIVCRNGSWSFLNNLESDIGICSPEKIGVITRTSNGSNDYICKEDGWQRATQRDFLGDCTAEMEYQMKPYAGSTYYCHDLQWTRADSIQAKIGVCTADREGDVDSLVTQFGMRSFVCDSLKWRWQVAADVYGDCQDTMEFKVYIANHCEYYCRDGEWKELSMEKDLGFCTMENKNELNFIVNSRGDSSWYICNGKFWYYAKGLEASLGPCVEERKNEIGTIDSVAYKCSGTTWITMTANEYLEKCDSTIWGKRLHYQNKAYLCKGTKWEQELAIDWDEKPCTMERSGETVLYEGANYVCKEGKWQEQ